MINLKYLDSEKRRVIVLYYEQNLQWKLYKTNGDYKKIMLQPQIKVRKGLQNSHEDT